MGETGELGGDEAAVRRPGRDETPVRGPGGDETPVRRPGGDETRVRRPGPVRWLWYAVGGRLPSRYRTWVLHDLACRTWAVRHIARALVQVAPVAVAVFLLVPGTPGIRIAAVTAG